MKSEELHRKAWIDTRALRLSRGWSQAETEAAYLEPDEKTKKITKKDLYLADPFGNEVIQLEMTGYTTKNI